MSGENAALPRCFKMNTSDTEYFLLHIAQTTCYYRIDFRGFKKKWNYFSSHTINVLPLFQSYPPPRNTVILDTYPEGTERVDKIFPSRIKENDPKGGSKNVGHHENLKSSNISHFQYSSAFDSSEQDWPSACTGTMD
jgi:hypothetical protein